MSSISAPSRKVDRQEFRVSGTWTPPAGFSDDALVRIIVWRAGGDGYYDPGDPDPDWGYPPMIVGGGGGVARQSHVMRLADLAGGIDIVAGAAPYGHSSARSAGKLIVQSSDTLESMKLDSEYSGGTGEGDGSSAQDRLFAGSGGALGQDGEWPAGGGGGGDGVTAGGNGADGGAVIFTWE